MADDALIAWINTGAKIELTGDEAAARQCAEFSARFVAALNPDGDLGETEEQHERALAARVYAVHADLNVLGEDVYSAVWSTLSAPVRRALKAYVAMGKP